jgi:hypothetical protein
MKSSKISPPKTDKFTGITIDRDEWEHEDSKVMEYSCNFCNRVLVRLSANDKNESWFRRQCSIEYPDTTEIRHKTKLGIQKQETEPADTSIQTYMAEQLEIMQTPELRGGFAQLAKKGTIRFTSYEER